MLATEMTCLFPLQRGSLLRKSWFDPSAVEGDGKRKGRRDLVLSAFQEEREKRRLEQLERKKELQRLLEEEDSKLKGKSPKQVTPGKVTRAQIEETIRKDQQQKENADTGLLAPQKGPESHGVGNGGLENPTLFNVRWRNSCRAGALLFQFWDQTLAEFSECFERLCLFGGVGTGWI